MAYTSGGLTEASDYNTLASSLSAVWGAGTGNKGYGQSTSAISQVSAASTVTATQWTGLLQTTNSERPTAPRAIPHYTINGDRR